MEPSGDITILTSTKLPLPHQVGDTKGVDVIYEHRTHHIPLEEGSLNQKHCGHLNDRSSPMTSLPNREETNQPPDATTTPNKTKDPHSPLGEVSNELDTTPDAREHTPSNVPSRYNTGMSNVVARHNPSHTYTNINGKDYTFATGTLQTHRHVTLGRPDPEPPDKS